MGFTIHHESSAQSRELHNNLSSSNVLLHFLDLHEDKVCIRVCDWEIATRIQEQRLSRYG